MCPELHSITVITTKPLLLFVICGYWITCFMWLAERAASRTKHWTVCRETNEGSSLSGIQWRQVCTANLCNQGNEDVVFKERKQFHYGSRALYILSWCGLVYRTRTPLITAASCPGVMSQTYGVSCCSYQSVLSCRIYFHYIISTGLGLILRIVDNGFVKGPHIPVKITVGFCDVNFSTLRAKII